MNPTYLEPTPTMVVDPGHPNKGMERGDEGYGASVELNDPEHPIFPTNGQWLHEKDLTLIVAKNIKRIADEHKQRGDNVRCVLTRDGDYPVSLKQRVALAGDYYGEDQSPANCFISIHFDWWNGDGARGSTIFHEESDSKSAELSVTMDGYFEGFTSIPHRRTAMTAADRNGSKHPYFYVLDRDNNPLPSNLLELMFVSSPEDMARLLNSGGKLLEQYAQVIYCAVRNWQINEMNQERMKKTNRRNEP